jgi:predicted HTH transcriptional regulator
MSEQLPLPGTAPSELEQCRMLGAKMASLKQEIKDLEEQAKAKEEEFKNIEQNLLPELFHNLEIDEIRMADGTRIKLEEFPVGRITEPKREAAFSWLRENNLDSIIKNVVNIPLDRGQDQYVDHIVELCGRLNLSMERKEAIHPMTLKAFIKEQAESPDFPRELFNVYEVRKVKFSD